LSDFHQALLPIITSALAELRNHDRLTRQWFALQRTTSRAGAVDLAPNPVVTS